MGDKLAQIINSPTAQIALPVLAGVASAATPGIGRGVGTALEAIRLRDVMRDTNQDREAKKWQFGEAQKLSRYRDAYNQSRTSGEHPLESLEHLSQIDPFRAHELEMAERQRIGLPTEEEAYASASKIPTGGTKRVTTRNDSEIQLAGPEVPKAIETETAITEANGRRLLINKRTGETVKDLGAVDTGGEGGTGGKAQSEAYTQLSNAMNVAGRWLALPDVPPDIAASGDIAKLVVWQYSQPKTKETIFAWLPTALKSSNLEERRAALRMQAAYKKYMNMFPEDVAGQEQPQQPQVQMKPEVQRAIEAARRARSGS